MTSSSRKWVGCGCMLSNLNRLYSAFLTNRHVILLRDIYPFISSIYNQIQVQKKPNIYKSDSSRQGYMQTIRKMFMHYLVKVLAPESPAYGNTIHFIKEQSLEEVISELEVGDIIFTKTNNSWYQFGRRLLGTAYDHVSVVINKNQVIHISPPIICKLDIQAIMSTSRQPIVYRFESDQINKQVFMNILTNFIGEKYNETAIPIMLKNQLISRLLEAQQDYNFSFQNLKYSKICTQAILYALCKANSKMSQSIQQFVNNQTQYKKLGFIMPDQMITFVQLNGAKIVYKSPESNQKTLMTKLQDGMEGILQKFAFIADFTDKMTLSPGHMLQVMKKVGVISNKLVKEHPIIKTLSIIVFFYEIFNGNKLNKILLLYSIVSTLMLYRSLPQGSERFSIKNSKL